MSHLSFRRLLYAIACSFVIVSDVMAQEPKPVAPDTLDKDYAAELPRTAPLSPAEAMKSFEIAPGFRLEQVAAEPLVADPIAICFDENSRMFVVEMRGYSENREEKLSRIQLLEDTDDDGKFDKSTTFADGLLWPTAIHCWRGGVFVADAPDLLYLKDTNGDGQADVKKVVLTGFETSNVQGLVNTFQWSLDNRITAAISSSGAELRKPDDPNGKALSLRGRDLSFDPETMDLAAISGGGQHGATTDIWGNRFVCSNSDHIQAILYEDRYLSRNPYLAVGQVRRSIATDGPQADVFRISPVEPWRIVRTRLRANKIVPGIVEGGGRPAGYFTSATGLTIYNGDAWPEMVGQAFVGDVGSNIVHRKQLVFSGGDFRASRIERDKEFLASRDTWFRPVQFANAPDGCLYICDMYRETIEHPQSIPPILKKHLDLTSGRDQGRIYRVFHVNSQLRKSLPKFGQASVADLAAALHHPNGWHRETAARLLCERKDREGKEIIEQLLAAERKADQPANYPRILYLLEKFGALSESLVRDRLEDSHPRLREHAYRLAEGHLHSARIRQAIANPQRHNDHLLDSQVRAQKYFTLGYLPVEERIAAVNSDYLGGEGYQTALLSSFADGAGLLLEKIAEEDTVKLSSKTGHVKLMQTLFRQIGKQQHPADVAIAIKILARWSEQKSSLVPVGVEALAARQDSPLARQLAKATGGKADEWLQEMIADAAKNARNRAAEPSDRVASLQQLRLAAFPQVEPVVAQLISPAEPAEVQSAALTLLGYFDAPPIADLLVARYEQLTPSMKSRSLDLLLSRYSWSLKLLEAIENNSVPALELDATRLKMLKETLVSRVDQRIQKISKSDLTPYRRDVLNSYYSVLKETGDATRGKEIFKKNCAACHKLQGIGHEIGPNLAAMKNRGAEAILVNVLDPNREVNPQYLNYLLLTTDGRSLSGILSAETATSVTLRKQENVSETILRVDIESLKSTGQSLMPVGLEKQIDRAAMVDLLEYLKTVE
ncbi:PVC-type heme-binding CxxCH protein [Anatilimnocola floriformis]|uniref:PVC-type heme-binding CxxCH protein n=1 Tax=Anatilimnocola floriformis TaxID=2948575 RepID=UPI0020C5118C|nr:PVC-type heme-binding CxxCH protein [Anatilimnocola floriformis]